MLHVQLMNCMFGQAHTHYFSLHRANWVKVNGTKYQSPCALVVGQSDDEELIFGSVLSTLVHHQEVFFEFEVMEGQYCKHYHAYALSLPRTSSQTYLIQHKDLPSFHPYGLYHCHHISNNSSLQYTVLRSNICI